MKYLILINCFGAVAWFHSLMSSDFSLQGIITGFIVYAVCLVVAAIVELAENPLNTLRKFFEMLGFAAAGISIIFGFVDGQYINSIEIHPSIPVFGIIIGIVATFLSRTESEISY
ncbi:hypothetical protein [Myxosarcina sp. GI1]|uniref:hypothetical protein n=1 Tax=Myxosarcina sp. GI1 TaxID=1541065 RepID=UPI000559CED7|nr:hypothetical protein [Myxosarcina sp. GI1]